MLEYSQVQTAHRVSSCSSGWWVATIISPTSHSNLHFFKFCKCSHTFFFSFQFSTDQSSIFFLLHTFLLNFMRFDFLLYLHCSCTEALGIGCCIKTFQFLSLRKILWEKKKGAQDTLSIIHSEIMTEKRQNEQSKSPDKQILAVSSCSFFFFHFFFHANRPEICRFCRC